MIKVKDPLVNLASVHFLQEFAPVRSHQPVDPATRFTVRFRAWG
jgi:hypothetical protein